MSSVKYEFRYMPLIGKLSGKSMLQQTETAINEIAEIVNENTAQAEIINTLAQDANDNSVEALEKADEALRSAGRTYINEPNIVNLDDYCESQLIYIGNIGSTNLPTLSKGFLEVKTNEEKTEAVQYFTADDDSVFLRTGTITAETVGDVTTYTATYGNWSQFVTDDVADSFAKVDASNVGVNADVDNSEKWADAIGVGAISNGNKKLITGEKVYTECRPSNGNYIFTGDSVAQNLTILDTALKSVSDNVASLSTNKANINSPALTGTPTAPTASAGTNTTQIATTAFVNTAVNTKAENYLPLAGGSMTGIINSNTNTNCDATSSTRYEETLSTGKDKNGQALGSDFYSAYDVDVFHGFRTSNPNVTNGNWADIRLHVNADKKCWISVDKHSNITDGTTDNSNNIPTTAFIHSNYLSLGGGTLTGALNLASNTWNKLGDDAFIGDHNVGGKACIKTQNNTATGIAFFDKNDTNVGQVEVNNEFNFNKTIKQNGTAVSLNGHTHSYLPLSGGTMTGAITASTSDFIKYNVNNSHLTIIGGTGYSNSASLLLNGGDSSNGGLFQLSAQNGTTSKFFTGYPDGKLTWDGKNVERVNASGTNYIRYESGLQIVYVRELGITATQTSVTFPVAFNENPTVILGVNGNVTAYSTGVSSSSFKFNVNSAIAGLAGRYIAIGKWK